METENFEFIRSKFKDVLANSSVHGIDKFIENEKKFLRFLWIVVLLTSFSVSVYIIATNIKEYKEYRTKVSVNIIRDMHAELPAVTICNANPFNNKIETLQYIVNMFVERNELFILDFLGLRSLVNSTKENEKLDTTSMEESSEFNISSIKTTADPVLLTEIHSTLKTGTTTEEVALYINDNITTITKSETPKAPSTLSSIPDTSPTISTAYTAVKAEISTIFDAITTVPIEPLSVTTDNSAEVDKTTSNTTGTIIEAPLTSSKIITTTSPSNVTLSTHLLNNLINEINEIKYSSSINETSATVENNLMFTVENYFENTTEAGPYIEYSQSNTNSTYMATTQYPQITFTNNIPAPSEPTVIINYTIKTTSTSYNEITTDLLEMGSTKDISSTAQNTNQPVTSFGAIVINDTTRSTQIIQPTSTLLISQITDISSENPTEATRILTETDTISDTSVATQTISLSTDTSTTTTTLPLTNPIQTEEGALNINDNITTITKSETPKAPSTLSSIPDTSPTISTAYTAVKTEISTIFDAITTVPIEPLSVTTDNSAEVDITTSLYRNLLNTTGTIIEAPLTLSKIITTTSPSNVTLYTQLLNNYTSINQTSATVENNLIFTVENYFENTTEAGSYIEHSQSNTNSTYMATTQYPQITFISDIPTPSEPTVIINYTIKTTSTSYNEITTGLLEMASTKDMSSTAQNTNQPITSIGVVVINDSTTSTKIIQPTSSLLISQITEISSENPTEVMIILTETETISDTSVATQTISLSTDTSTTTTTLPLTNPIQTTLYDISETGDTASTTQLTILSATSIEMATTTENNIQITSFSSTKNSTEILLTNTIETTLFEMLETSDTALATLTNVQTYVTSIGLNERVDTTSTAHYELPLITSTEMTTRVGNSEIIADLLPTEATEISMTNPFETTGNTENLTNFSEYILTYEPNGSFLTSANLAAQDSTKNPKTAIYLNNTISPDEYSTQSTTNSPPNVTAVNNTNLATTVSKTQTNNSTSITTTLKTDSSKSKTSTKPTSRSSKSDKSLKVIDRNNNIVQTIYSIFQTNNLNTILSEILDSIRAYVVSDKNLDNGRRYFLGQYIEDFILSFSFKNQNINNLKENNTHFWNYQYGNCYTMHPGKLKPTFVNGDTVDYIFEIFAGNASDVGKYLDSNGIHVFVHDKNTDSILLDDGTNIPTGVCGQIDVMKKVRNNLKNPYSECIDSLSTFENSNRRIYNYMSDLKLTVYNQPLCFKLCFQDKLFDKCGCLDYRKPLINNASFCVDFNQLDCMKRFENHFTTTNLNDLCTPVCPKQCHTTTYSINKHLSNYPTSTYAKYLKDILPKNVPDEPNNLKKYLEKSVLKLIVRYKYSSYESFDDVPCITINQLLGNTGGYLGLFLGISILSILELANYFIYLIIAFIRR